MLVRALGAVILGVLSTASMAACADPAPLPRVHVTLHNLQAAIVPEYQPTSIELVVMFPGIAGDAGMSVRRSIFWDDSDTFEFDVQIPAGAYGPPQLEVSTLVECGVMIYVERVVAEGAASTGFSVSTTGGTTDAPPIRASARLEYCR